MPVIRGLKIQDFNPLSAQAERQKTTSNEQAVTDFNPLSAQAERRLSYETTSRDMSISIHSPRKQRDLTNGVIPGIESIFQSTLRASRETLYASKNSCPINISIHSPRKQRDVFDRYLVITDKISIHSPRKQRDPVIFVFLLILFYFNPLSAQAERQRLIFTLISERVFQSTLRASRETLIWQSLRLMV